MVTLATIFPRGTLRRVMVGDALRGGIISAVPAMASALLGDPLLCWSAIAAFWTCFCDPGGARRTRLFYGVVFGLLASMASAFAAWIGTIPAVALVLVAMAGFIGGFAASLGPTVGSCASLVVTAFAISLVSPVATPENAVRYGLYFLYGNAWALAFGVVFWKSDPLAAARRAAANGWEDLATTVRSFAKQLVRLEPRSDTCSIWRVEVRKHIETVRKVASDYRRSSSVEFDAQARRALSLVEELEQVLACAAALDDLVARWSRVPSSHFWQAAQLSLTLEQLASLLDMASSSIGFDDEPPCEFDVRRRGFRARIDGFEDVCTTTALPRDYYADSVAIVTALRNADLAIERASRLQPVAASTDSSQRISLLSAAAETVGRLYREFKPGSLWFQHGFRVALVCVIAVFVVQHTQPNHGYWLILTALFLMQPTVANTLTLSAQRVAGTLLGAVLAVTIGAVVHSPLMLGLCILPLAVGTLAGRTVSYWAYTLFLTSHFVIVAQLGQPQSSEVELALARLLNSAGGAAIAAGVSLLAWPRFERHQLASALGLAMKAEADYLGAALRVAARDGNSPRVSLKALRRKSCLAIDAAEESIHRTLFEPSAQVKQAAAARRIVAALRRATGGGAMLEVLSSMEGEATSSAVLTAFAGCVEAEMQHCAQAIRDHSAREDVAVGTRPVVATAALPQPLQQAVRCIADEVEAVGHRARRLGSLIGESAAAS